MNKAELENKINPRNIVERWSAQERLMLGSSMTATVKKLLAANIQHQNPKISKSELRKQTFLRFYQNDFPPEMLQRILPKLKF